MVFSRPVDEGIESAPESNRSGENRPGENRQKQQQLPKEIRRTAMNMLARRENSRKELGQKLGRKFPRQEKVITEALEGLTSDGLQSDQRFSESYLRWLAAKGFGAVRIGMELAQKGIDETVIEQALDAVGIDWNSLLENQFRKKYHSQLPTTAEERAKAIRFFLYRGFSMEQINRLCKSSP